MSPLRGSIPRNETRDPYAMIPSHAGRGSIRINDRRVTFRWEQQHAYEVRVEDYH
jgi:hypothetical protein